MSALETNRVPAESKPDSEARELKATIEAAVAQAITERENLKSDPDPIKLGSSQGTKVIFTLVLILFLGSCLYNYVEMRAVNQPLDLTVEQRVDAMDVHLYTLQSRVRDFRLIHGRYPVDLAEIGVPADNDLDYLVNSDREFYLSYRIGGVARSYNSEEPPERLLQGEFTRSAFRGGVASARH